MPTGRKQEAWRASCGAVRAQAQSPLEDQGPHTLSLLSLSSGKSPCWGI